MNRISVFYEHMAEAMKQENITLDEVCAAVKRFGFDGVELDANRIKNEGDVILPALQKAGLCVNGMCPVCAAALIPAISFIMRRTR